LIKRIATILSIVCSATLLVCQSAFATDGSRHVNASGLWSDSANWLSGNIADGVGATGNFTFNLATSGKTVTLDSNRTLGILNIGDSTSAFQAGDLAFGLGQAHVVGGLKLGGVLQTNPGTYSSSLSGADHQFDDTFTGLGTLDLTLIPEPATYMLLGVGLLVCAQRLRRKRA
jgi:hypothetical protein